MDMKLIKRGIEIYQGKTNFNIEAICFLTLKDYYPERLETAYVIGLPSSLVGIWYAIENLFDDRTRKRIKVLKDDQPLTELFVPHLLPKGTLIPPYFLSAHFFRVRRQSRVIA